MREKDYVIVYNLADLRSASVILSSITFSDDDELSKHLTDVRRGLRILINTMEKRVPELEIDE